MTAIAWTPQSHFTPAEARPKAAGDTVVPLLRLEGALALGAAVLAYRAVGGGWPMFAALFLAPDLGMLGYLAGRRPGAAIYNAAHTYLAPAALALAGLSLQAPSLYGPALVWAAHIGFDRLMGYGLKHPSAFGATHLGWRGRAAPGRERS